MPRRMMYRSCPRSLPAEGTVQDMVDMLALVLSWCETEGRNPVNVDFRYETQYDGDDPYAVDAEVTYRRMETESEMLAREERECERAADAVQRRKKFDRESLQRMFKEDPDFVKDTVIELIQGEDD